MATENIRTSAGTTIGISAAQPATYNQTGFAALTYAEISEVENLGEFGAQYNLVTFNPLANRTTVKRKGSKNNGSLQMTLARDPEDAGQGILKTASDSDVSPSFVVTTQDGTKFYFTAQVMGYTSNVGGVDNIYMASATLEIDNEIIEVAV